ncbi:MAG: S1/P1 nuclease [Paraglaciecola sp.]|uniref:S1/P1 nuclease n=1 Tax=Paraglaciecola sp. TaxID=1920173 RepID=UPI00273F115D|nr:S1/P1 nuclease [Paraglaciecola sp.]MDP5032406.1 S1/P1 nuclease [Paraglaciecola sp.]MDP5040022.1 S1/P1 nuclease [Paraglaciecola sp.]MDP5130124.1 S1/P1 nuclease [Paraglaciecola sp.]
MKLKTIVFAVTSILLSGQAVAWGQNGHRVTGAIAEQYLTPQAKQAIANMLGNEDLAEASTYPDEMRSDPSEFWKKTANPWHYVTVPAGHSYHDVEPPKEGDALTALNSFTSTLKDPKASLADKQLALRFIVHIIGDLHQPLHVGNGTDKGGNEVKLEFFWQDSNLHRVWDSELMDKRELSYTEWTTILSRKISEKQLKEWSVTDPQVWIKESSVLRDSVYPSSNKLSWDYLYQHMPTVQQRLQMGGVRIAAYLNEVLE